MDSDILLQLFFALAMAGVMTLLAWYWGYFKRTSSNKVRDISLIQVVFAFFVWVLIQLLALYFFQGLVTRANGTLDYLAPWLDIAMIVSAPLVIIALSLSTSIWKKSEGSWFKNFLFGAVSWFVSYPWVLVAASLATIGLTYYLGTRPPDMEQDVVKKIKEVAQVPYLMPAYFLLVGIIIPITEEILFRGMLQNWIAKYLPGWQAIGLTSVLFSLLHVTGGQGIGNFQLVPGLFVLSCFLGYVYERQKNIWAPIGLHVAVNMISLALIIYQ